jgi:hypothetical protein
MAWIIGGWLLLHFLGKIGPEATQACGTASMLSCAPPSAASSKPKISLSDTLSLEMLRSGCYRQQPKVVSRWFVQIATRLTV